MAFIDCAMTYIVFTLKGGFIFTVVTVLRLVTIGLCDPTILGRNKKVPPSTAPFFTRLLTGRNKETIFQSIQSVGIAYLLMQTSHNIFFIIFVVTAGRLVLDYVNEKFFSPLLAPNS